VRSNISLLAAANSSSSGNSSENGTAPRTIPQGGVPVPYPVSLLSDVSTHGTSELDLGFRQGLVALEANAEDGQLQVRQVGVVVCYRVPGAVIVVAAVEASSLLWTAHCAEDGQLQVRVEYMSTVGCLVLRRLTHRAIEADKH
jgi:hypothetical protein